ncbi:DUF5931 domain-containing protein [Dactylosporangium sp. CA-092794]|uniref:DUF5931 domain-containing protein n=1 Tax=Dactylosporangium sp. CA-092794 TaxID=3239929 RepID=UPI003D9127A8
MSDGVGRDGVPGLEGPLWRALLVFRLAALGYAAVLMVNNFRDYAWPPGGWLILAIMTAWTAVSSLAYARPERRGWPLLTADLLVAAGCLLASRWIVDPGGLGVGSPTLPMAWVACPVVAWAISGGRRRGAIAAILLSAADVVVRDGLSQATVNGPVLMILAGIGVGHIARLAIDAETRMQRATELEAATRERERLARGIHDSVLQVLALVQRRGAELGGEAAELGRLAGEQESVLRTLVTAAAPPYPTPPTPPPSPPTTPPTAPASAPTSPPATPAVSAAPPAAAADSAATTAPPAALASAPTSPAATPAWAPASPAATPASAPASPAATPSSAATFPPAAPPSAAASGATVRADTAEGATHASFADPTGFAEPTGASGAHIRWRRRTGRTPSRVPASPPPPPDVTDLRSLLAPHASSTVTIAAPATPILLPSAVAAEVTAAVAAALDNVTRHAGPSARAWLLLEDLTDTITVTIRDNGTGIPDGRLAEAERAGRLGVAQSIRGRIRDLGGTVTVTSLPSSGTEVELHIPR